MPVESSDCPHLGREALRVRSLSMEEPLGESQEPRDYSRANETVVSEPSSPLRQPVPRCRSQPSVLHERKCLKRRRDEDRPALDFLKMKEVCISVSCTVPYYS